MLHSAGFSVDEIADKLEAESNTIRKHLSNIKDKLGWRKASELAGVGICDFLGVSYSEVRQKILSAVLLILFTLSIPQYDQVYRRARPVRARIKQETELITT